MEVDAAMYAELSTTKLFEILSECEKWNLADLGMETGTGNIEIGT